MTPERIAQNLNKLLAKHGLTIGESFKGGDIRQATVGCWWCDCNYAFDVTLPNRFEPVIAKVIETLTSAGLDVHRSNWSHLGDEGTEYTHLIAWVLTREPVGS